MSEKIDRGQVEIELKRRKLLRFIRHTMAEYDAQQFHVEVCEVIERWYNASGPQKAMVFMPPQHGKSQISTRHTPAWMLGLNPDLKVGIATYNGTVASKFNRDCQRIIDKDEYRQIFPNTKLARNGHSQNSDGSVRNNSEFEIVGRKGSLVSVGVGGGLTSLQIDVMIIDDVYKDSQEAWSSTQRLNVQEWYETVVQTRLHNDSKVLIVFTRWHELDLAGHLLAEEPGEWEVVKFSAIKEGAPTENDPRKDGEALWPGRHSLERLLKIKAKNKMVFDNLYQQDPKPSEGLLYSQFKTYSEKDLMEAAASGARRNCYVDVADKGSDYFCAIFYVSTSSGHYVTRIIYTQDGTEVTELLLAEGLLVEETQKCYIESNAGGSIFGRNVKKKFRELGGKACAFKVFHQSKNKEARIISGAATVMETVIFHRQWNVHSALFYRHLTRFEKVFKKNEHDDCADCVTGIIDKEEKGGGRYAIGGT